MTTSTKQDIEPTGSIHDTFKDGRLVGRSLSKGDFSFSMDYHPDLGTFFGSVTQKKGSSYESIYNSTEDVGSQWAELPYSELIELREMLIKVWEDNIQKWRLSPRKSATIDDIDDLLDDLKKLS